MAQGTDAVYDMKRDNSYHVSLTVDKMETLTSQAAEKGYEDVISILATFSSDQGTTKIFFFLFQIQCTNVSPAVSL